MRLLLTGLILAAVSAFASTQDDEKQSIQAGVYTKEQAEQGRTLFTEVCEACHHPDEFSGAGYMESWSGQAVGDFVELMRSTMPQDTPGRLQSSEYIAIAAYLFQLNGVPEGEKEMERAALGNLRIEGPFSKQ